MRYFGLLPPETMIIKRFFIKISIPLFYQPNSYFVVSKYDILQMFLQYCLPNLTFFSKYSDSRISLWSIRRYFIISGINIRSSKKLISLLFLNHLVYRLSSKKFLLFYIYKKNKKKTRRSCLHF